MRLSFPYNEILPKYSAHDAYLFRNCASLAAQGLEVELACGRGSWPLERLEAHYQWPRSGITLTRLPILRRNFLPFSWNRIFFSATQRHLERKRPDWVALSVLKQGIHHLDRRIAGVRYVYEVHELAWYPGAPMDARRERRRALERAMLEKANLVTVTTEALRGILLAPPYSLTVPVKVIPLAVRHAALPPPSPGTSLRAMYIGQLYSGQGLELLLAALAQTRGIELTVVGGKADEIARLAAQAATLRLGDRVRFLGFHPPSELDRLAEAAQVFVAPFEASGRMAYVAHTKLLEYAAWGRPVIAPDLPVVREHFPGGEGLAVFQAGSPESLAATLNQLQRQPDAMAALQRGIARHRVTTWPERAARYLAALSTT